MTRIGGNTQRKRLAALLILLSALLAVFGRDANAQTKPALVAFRAGELELKGFLWKPEGAGPFPAVLWNHGSEKLPGAVDRVAGFFVPRGYVFFVPHRRGHGRSPGPYIMDALRAAATPAARSAMIVRLHEAQLQDQLAALAHLQTLPFVDRNRLAVIGFSLGGIQAMLAVERASGYRVAVNCSGAAQSWQSAPDLQRRLIQAARRATMPVFFLQAQNDYDLTPNRVLAQEVKAAGQPVEAKVYPPHGSSAQDGHNFCVAGANAWGPDALRFIEARMK